MAASTRVFVPCETSALSMGADFVAGAIEQLASRQGTPIQLIRNGSYGATWLEPLVEVETAEGRTAYGPVATGDVESLFASGLLTGGDHKLKLGVTEKIPYIANQKRLTCSRCGVIDPASLDEFRTHGGFSAFEKALTMSPADIIEEVTKSGLRGRGGAAFPTGIKWQTVANAEGEQKYIACNADEGDSGTFSDRLLMEGDPFCLIEGMAIAGRAVGADKGYVYLRSEYPVARRIFTEALATAREHGWLGEGIQGSDFSFEIYLHIGAGSYVCGEETSMLESLEGKAGIVRYKPPLPAFEGLFGKPTAVNNVITLASVPVIIEQGGAAYADYGSEKSRGTLPFQLAGNIKRGGMVETEFGLTLRQLIEDWGGGTASGRPVRAVQIGGPLGAYFPESLLDTPLEYEAFIEQGGMIGHGGIVVFDDTVDMLQQARFAMEFCAIESCGKCTPCRIGSVRGVEVIDKIMSNNARDANLGLLAELCETMIDGSLCAMGGMTPFPVQSALKHFPEDFRRAAG